MTNLRRGASLLVAAVLVVSGGFFFFTRHDVQPEPNVPPAGTIWFGTSFDTKTLAVSGEALSFAQGSRVVMVAHFSATVPGGQGTNLVVDGVSFPEGSASASNYDLLGAVILQAFLTTGPHTFEVEDLGGNSLAAGIVTITP